MNCRLSQRHQRLLICVVLSTILLLGSFGVVGAQQDLPNNSTNQSTEPPPHLNPDEIDTPGDLQGLEAFLRGSMNSRLEGSIANLNQQQYDQARELLGEEYNGDLSRYVELAEDVDTQQEAELFVSAQSEQRTYIDRVEEYEETRSEYDQAREDGDQDRTRELAREVVRSAEQLNRDGRSLSETYRDLGNETSDEYTEQISEIEDRTEEARETRQAVIESELTETTLSVTANRSSVSLTDSILLTGEIQTVDGGPIESQQAQISIQNQTSTVDVDTNGEFELAVQPDSVWKSETDELQVQYLPERSSEYLGSRTRISVSVASTETTVDIESVSERTSYDDPLEINGTLTATETGEPVPLAPVSLRLDGNRIGTTETTADGQFSFSSDVPVGVSTGETTAEVSLVSSPLALDRSNEETSVIVEATETAVSIDAATSEDGTESAIQVSGSVDSAGGRPVTAVPVTIQIDETVVGIAETDSNGQFTGQFGPPDSSEPGDRVTIEATFDEQGSNLESATGSATVVLPETMLQSVGGSSSGLAQIDLLALISLVSVLGAVGWWLRRKPSISDQPVTGAVSAPTQSEPNQEQKDLLAVATGHLNAGAHKTAATVAYAAARRQLRDEVDVSETATHWEWYQACVAAGVDRLSELETLTEAFEQVTFAPDTGGNADAASRAVSAADQFVNGEH